MAFKSRVKVRDSDPGFRKLRKRFKGPDRVDIGVFGEKVAGKTDKDGNEIDLVIIAASNEFGTDTIPERSFMRAGVDENKKEFETFLAKGSFAVIAGKLSKRQLIGRLGLLGVKKIQEKIESGPFKANKPKTVQRKGSSKPLIDTGRLRQSITHRLAEEGAAGKIASIKGSI